VHHHQHQPHHPPLLGAHHYQHQQPPQQPQQQQFVFGHGPASGQQPQQQVADTPRPESLVLPPAVAQSKSFVPPRPPSLIIRAPAAPASAPAPAIAPVSADSSAAAGQQAVPPSPRRSILGAIAGLGKGRRNTDLARHRKGQSSESKGDHQGPPAADGGHNHHQHPTAAAAETTEPQKAGTTKAHLLRNPLLGGGHRNTLQEMLKGSVFPTGSPPPASCFVLLFSLRSLVLTSAMWRGTDKEVEEERRKRRELREKKKEEVKKQNEELKKKELQEQKPAVRSK
jgi:hypothetical protein